MRKNNYLKIILITAITIFTIFLLVKSFPEDIGSGIKEHGILPETELDGNANSYVKDSVDWKNNIIRTFGQDSIYIFNPQSILLSKEYLDSLSVIRQIIFMDSKIDFIIYNSQNTPNFLMSESFDTETGCLFSRSYKKDSIIMENDHSVHCNEYYIDYYADGQIQKTGQQGFVGGGGAAVGLHKEYGKNGKLLTTRNYIYPDKMFDDGIESESYLSYVVESEYYDNSKPKWRKIYRNYGGYDTDHPDMDENGQLKLGVWEFYDEQGNVVRTEKHSYFNEKTGEYKKMN